MLASPHAAVASQRLAANAPIDVVEENVHKALLLPTPIRNAEQSHFVEIAVEITWSLSVDGDALLVVDLYADPVSEPEEIDASSELSAHAEIASPVANPSALHISTDNLYSFFIIKHP